MVRKQPTQPQEVANTAAERHARSLVNYPWAVNANKVTRALQWVKNNQAFLKLPMLEADELEAAVKARYIELGGLLSEKLPQNKAASRARVENLADNDEDDD